MGILLKFEYFFSLCKLTGISAEVDGIGTAGLISAYCLSLYLYFARCSSPLQLPWELVSCSYKKHRLLRWCSKVLIYLYPLFFIFNDLLLERVFQLNHHLHHLQCFIICTEILLIKNKKKNLYWNYFCRMSCIKIVAQVISYFCCLVGLIIFSINLLIHIHSWVEVKLAYAFCMAC